jgi:hypothetical protein
LEDRRGDGREGEAVQDVGGGGVYDWVGVLYSDVFCLMIEPGMTSFSFSAACWENIAGEVDDP